MIFGLFVKLFATFTAFSSASAPLFAKNTFFSSPFTGAMDASFSASATYPSWVTTLNMPWKYLSACALTASTTSGCENPIFRTPTPPIQSRNLLPSTSCIMAPSPLSITTGYAHLMADGTAFSLLFITSAAFGPGSVSVIISGKSVLSIISSSFIFFNQQPEHHESHIGGQALFATSTC